LIADGRRNPRRKRCHTLVHGVNYTSERNHGVCHAYRCALCCRGHWNCPPKPHRATGFPFMQIFYDATSSLSGASAMICIIITMDIAAAIAFLATSSRIVWAFSRDRGLPFWRNMSKVCGFPSLKVFATELTRHYRSSRTRLFPSTLSGSWLASLAPSAWSTSAPPQHSTMSSPSPWAACTLPTFSPRPSSSGTVSAGRSDLSIKWPVTPGTLISWSGVRSTCRGSGACCSMHLPSATALLSSSSAFSLRASTRMLRIWISAIQWLEQ